MIYAKKRGHYIKITQFVYKGYEKGYYPIKFLQNIHIFVDINTQNSPK